MDRIWSRYGRTLERREKKSRDHLRALKVKAETYYIPFTRTMSSHFFDCFYWAFLQLLELTFVDEPTLIRLFGVTKLVVTMLPLLLPTGCASLMEQPNEVKQAETLEEWRNQNQVVMPDKVSPE